MTEASLDLGGTMGCFFITGILTTVLWTASTVQLYFYFERCSKRDTWRLKTHVTLVWIVDTALQVAILRTSYIYFVNLFGNFIALTHFDKSTFPLFTIMSAIINTLVQTLFIVRIWHMSKKCKVLTGVTIFLVLSQFGIITAYFSVILPMSDVFQLASVVEVERAMDITIAVVDTVIGAILVVLLHNSRSGFKRTDSIVNRLIIYTVASGLLTAVDAIVTLITSLAFSGTLLYFLFASIGPKLYVNSMLALLNSRENVQGQLRDGNSRNKTVASGAIQTISTDSLSRSNKGSNASLQEGVNVVRILV